MISDKQLEANRRNARHSTGPKSEKGKHTVSHNAIRHGLTGQLVIMTPEEREAHDKFCRELIESLNPETAIEHQLAHSVAEDHWRINRLRATENNVLAKASAGAQSAIESALDTAEAFLREARQLQLLSLYEQRINRNIHRNHQQLRELQAERKALLHADLEEAKLLAQLSLSQGKAYDPAADFPGRSIANGQALSATYPLDTQAKTATSGQVSGFVFSTAQINHAIDRDNRLTEAKAAAKAPSAAPNAKIHALTNRAA